VESHRQGAQLFTALCVLIGLLLIAQLWLVGAALDAMLGGQAGVLWPAAGASLVLFGVNVGLLRYAYAFDARLRRSQ
jgi:hypothetical protein